MSPSVWRALSMQGSFVAGERDLIGTGVKSFKSWLIFVNHLPLKFGTYGDKTNGYFMEQVEAEIDNLRTSVFELKSSLYRADRARMQYQDVSGMSPWLNATATCFLALFFLLI